MKTFRFEERNHFGPARSICPGAVNQDNIFDPLGGARLSESFHVESGRQGQHNGRDQNASIHLRNFHLRLLVKRIVGTKPEQNSPRNWTNVLTKPKRWLDSAASKATRENPQAIKSASRPGQASTVDRSVSRRPDRCSVRLR